MITSTKGIVLKYYPYGESSIIVKIFTEVFGLQSYIVKGVFSKRSKTGLAVFQPLNLIEFLAYRKENKTLHYLKEPSVAFHYQSIPFDLIKRSIVFFLSELMYKTIREETPDKPLFEWLYNTLTWFDLTGKNMLNFHLVFMIQLSRFLGFYPKPEVDDTSLYFDLQEGKFVHHQPSHAKYISGKETRILRDLCTCTLEHSDSLKIITSERRSLIDQLITYYQLHLPDFGSMKSVEVLKSVLE